MDIGCLLYSWRGGGGTERGRVTRCAPPLSYSFLQLLITTDRGGGGVVLRHIYYYIHPCLHRFGLGIAARLTGEVTFLARISVIVTLEEKEAKRKLRPADEIDTYID